MKLISMHVDNFGCLHNYDYNFEEGLNVVLHDNGWGKTTVAAFLKAMLYGYDTKRTKDITENERKRYLPWQGEKYGGSLDFEAGDVRYRIYRSFGKTPRYDVARIVNLDTRTPARISPDKLGETLFHLDANAFQRSVFINQNGLSIDGAASSIHARLNALLSQANDVAAFDGAIADLTQQIKVYEKTGDRGDLGAITRQIATKERIRDRLEKDITNQDAARERISEIDILLNVNEKELKKKTEKLDAVSGETKKREATKKLLNEINGKIADLQKQIDRIRKDLGGKVPSYREIDQVKRQIHKADDLKKQVLELEKQYANLNGEYDSLLKKYNGVLPQSSQLDRIQNIYGEMQGVLSADSEEVISEALPEGYKRINAIVKTDPDYKESLQKTIGMQASFQKMIHKLESQDRDLQNYEEALKQFTENYKVFKSEVDRLQESVKKQERYCPAVVEPVIARLEELQKREQEVDVKRKALSSKTLTQEQEKILRDNPGALPDISEGKEILKKQRDIDKRKAEIEGLNSRLDGENSKEESLKASLEQLETLTAVDTVEPTAPGKSSGTTMIGAGAAIAVLGVILGFVTLPIFFALAVVGLVLVALGVVSNNNYKQKQSDYEVHKSAAGQNKDTIRKRDELLEQQKTVEYSIASLKREIAESNRVLHTEQSVVAEWVAKWAPAGESPSETLISQILERAEDIAKLREKQEEIAAAKGFIDEQAAIMKSERADIDAFYPECSGKTVSESLSFLRINLSAYNIAESQLQTAVKNESWLLKEAGMTQEELNLQMSPKAAELKALKDKTAISIQQQLEEANHALACLNLDTDKEHIVQALHEADDMFRQYTQYAGKLKDKTTRQSKKQQKIENLRKELNAALVPLSSRYDEKEVPERISIIRSEIDKGVRLQAKIKETGRELERERGDLIATDKAVKLFSNLYGHFTVQSEDIFSEIFEKAGKHAELMTAVQQLKTQQMSMESGQQKVSAEEGSEEAKLRKEVEQLKTRREDLVVEYTQVSDFIRQADKSLEEYPDTIQEIRELYEKKQKAQNKLAILKRSIQLIRKAKENLANRYLSRVEDLFNSYMRIWMDNDTVRGLLDIDFNITIEEKGETHVVEGYSTGYCDMIDFCMRLALIDTLFENEQPFLILDDPFVNLDAIRLEKALELLGVMAANKQVIYFVCHPIRAIETDKTSASRAEFLKLAEKTRETIKTHKTSKTSLNKAVRKTPKELYTVVNKSSVLPFRPVNPNYTITNNIFSMNFVLNETGVKKDNTYELFFIDAVGHVLNDRQIIEVSNGKLSTERVQFSLNTRDDSGNQFELMIRESGQDDYDVVARIPFAAKLAFAGTFNFDF